MLTIQLLPELSMGSFFEKQIKTEAIDIECQEIQISQPTAAWCSNQVEVKNELDVDYDENSTFFESKSFNSSFQSTSDDCDEKRNESNNFQMFDQKKHIFSSEKNNLCKRKLSKKFIQQYSEDNDMEHVCQQCYKKFSTKYALVNHLKRHANFKEHVCEICGVAKITRTELQTHMRSHQPNVEKFKCNLCPQEFKFKNAIQRHVRAVHEGLRPYACSYCPKKFGTQSSRKSHERLHTGERPYSCEVCHRSFVQSECLRSHMKNHDKSLRTHVCRYCSQRFITRKNLIDHEERHRGDKPHICEICNRGFCKEEDLINHHKLHENSKNSSVYEAPCEGNVDCAEGYSEPFPETPDNAIMDRKSPCVISMLNIEASKDILDLNSIQKYNNLVSNNSSELGAATHEIGKELYKSSNSFPKTCTELPHQELEVRPLSPYVSCDVAYNQIDSET